MSMEGGESGVRAGGSEMSPGVAQSSGVGVSGSGSVGGVSSGGVSTGAGVSGVNGGSTSSVGGVSGSGANRAVLDALRSSGYELGQFSDDRSFLGAVNQALQERSLLQQQLAEYQALLQQQLSRSNSELKGGVESKGVVSGGSSGGSGWSPPEYDETWDQFLRYDEGSGQWVPSVVGVPFEVVQAKNANWKYRQEWATKFRRNPAEAIKSLLWDEIKKGMQEELRQTFEQLNVAKETEDYLAEKAKHFFVDGQVDHTGDPAKLTPIGRMAAEFQSQLDEWGVTNPKARRELTNHYIGSELSRQYWSKRLQSPGVGGSSSEGSVQDESQKRRWLGGVGHSASSGALSSPGSPSASVGNGRARSLAEIAAARLAEMGIQ